MASIDQDRPAREPAITLQSQRFGPTRPQSAHERGHTQQCSPHRIQTLTGVEHVSTIAHMSEAASSSRSSGTSNGRASNEASAPRLNQSCGATQGALVDALAAAQQQVCAAQAGLLQAVHELAIAGRYPTTTPSRAAPFRGMEIAAAMTWSQYTADQTMAMAALALDVAPVVMTELRQGRLDWAKVKMLCHELADVQPEHVDLIVGTLRPDFGSCTVNQLRERLRRLALQVDPLAAQQRYAKAVDRRRVEHRACLNGTGVLGATGLPADRVAAAWDHVDRLAYATRSAGDPRKRSLSQLRADVFVDLLAGVDPGSAGAAAVAPRKGSINLRIDLTTLACLNDDPALIPGYGPIVADIARQTAEQMARTAQWRFTVADAGSTIAEGRLRYRPTRAQQAFIAARDVTCRAPGCPRLALRCEVDHVVDWATGGTTTVDNLCSLCSFHHQAKHKGGFRVRRTNGGIEWTTPFGRRYRVLPHDGPSGPATTSERGNSPPERPEPEIRR